MSSPSMSDVVVTGIGVVTAKGVGLDAQWDAITSGVECQDLTLESFQAAPHLTDRRMLKAVSKVDAIGLAAIEVLAKNSGFKAGQIGPARVGLYVGSPPASNLDNEPYLDALNAARDDKGHISIREFGKTCMTSRPTTLLVGLPNNVLCYGAMILDARGPNSNYTSVSQGGVMAVINAARRVKRRQIDLGVAGGFTQHNEPVNLAMFESLGLAASGKLGGMRIADAGAFVTVETRATAKNRGSVPMLRYMSGAMTSDGLGPSRFDPQGVALERAIRTALKEAGAREEDIGLVLAGGTGIRAVDICELSVLSRVFAKLRARPALGCSGRLFGNLMEAGGVLEIALAARIMEFGLPKSIAAPDDSGFAVAVDPGKPYALILRTCAAGEHAALVVKKEETP